jgi:hypothetical protein
MTLDLTDDERRSIRRRGGRRVEFVVTGTERR